MRNSHNTNNARSRHPGAAEIDILIGHYDTFLQFLVDATGVGSQPAIIRHREGDTLVVLGIIAVTGRLLLLPTPRRSAVLHRRSRSSAGQSWVQFETKPSTPWTRLSFCSQSRRLLQVLSGQLLRAHKYEQRAYGTANLPPVFSINAHMDRAGVPRQERGRAPRYPTRVLRDTLIAWMGEHAWTCATIYDAWQMFEMDGQTVKWTDRNGKNLSMGDSWMGDSWMPPAKQAEETQAFLACPSRRALLDASYRRNAGGVDGGEGKKGTPPPPPPV